MSAWTNCVFSSLLCNFRRSPSRPVVPGFCLVLLSEVAWLSHQCICTVHRLLYLASDPAHNIRLIKKAFKNRLSVKLCCVCMHLTSCFSALSLYWLASCLLCRYSSLAAATLRQRDIRKKESRLLSVHPLSIHFHLSYTLTYRHITNPPTCICCPIKHISLLCTHTHSWYGSRALGLLSGLWRCGLSCIWCRWSRCCLYFCRFAVFGFVSDWVDRHFRALYSV